IVFGKQTCHAFYKAMSTRSVWVSAFHRVCNQHGIFKPTYPMEKMTLAELEHAASRPRRFFSSREKLSGTETSDGLYRTSHLFLVPGGPFLITAGAQIVYLWDLGYNMYTPVKPFPVATTPVNGNVFILTASLASETGQTVLNVTVHTHLAILALYQINPLSPQPAFHLKGELQLN
ncbi:hypothetical protein FA13DRAFT_1583720, partial [Coprinellus micaceus]